MENRPKPAGFLGFGLALALFAALLLLALILFGGSPTEIPDVPGIPAESELSAGDPAAR